MTSFKQFPLNSFICANLSAFQMGERKNKETGFMIYTMQYILKSCGKKGKHGFTNEQKAVNSKPIFVTHKAS